MKELLVWLKAAVLINVILLSLSACETGSGAPKQTAMKVALLIDWSGLNDHGFDELAYQGYFKAARQYGFAEDVIQSQNMGDYVANLTQAAKQADLIVAVSVFMQTPIYRVAKQFPSKSFAIVDGCAIPPNKTNCEALPNVTPLLFKEQEAGCLVGAIAGQMELDGPHKIPRLLGRNTIGAVGAFAIPPIIRYISGYKYCAQKVNPQVNVVISYSQSFTDIQKCNDLARYQITQHQADIIFQVAGGCGIGTLDATNKNQVYGIGVDADQGYLYPSVVASALKRVDVAVYDTIDSFQKDKYSNKPPLFDLAHNGVGYAEDNNNLPSDAQNMADSFAKDIINGTLVPPTQIP